jgi:hypothetical protein
MSDGDNSQFLPGFGNFLGRRLGVICVHRRCPLPPPARDARARLPPLGSSASDCCGHITEARKKDCFSEFMGTSFFSWHFENRTGTKRNFMFVNADEGSAGPAHNHAALDYMAGKAGASQEWLKYSLHHDSTLQQARAPRRAARGASVQSLGIGVPCSWAACIGVCAVSARAG